MPPIIIPIPMYIPSSGGAIDAGTFALSLVVVVLFLAVFYIFLRR